MSRHNPGGSWTIWSNAVGYPAAPFTLRAALSGGMLRIWAAGVLVVTLDARGEIPAGRTRHGAYIGQAAVRIDALTIANAAAIPDNPAPGFVYRGRDTKLADIAGGA